MRLIDADALIARWKAAMLHMEKVESGMHPVGMETVIDDVAHRPTIEAEPVRYGRWEYRAIDTPNLGRKYEMYCTACGKTPDPKKDFDCCPNCGAEMDKEG